MTATTPAPAASTTPASTAAPAPPAAPRGRSRDGIAKRLAVDLQDGYVVNLGVGIPL